MIIENRKIERYQDGLNTTYFLTGDKPLPKIFIDLIEGRIYTQLGINYFGEKMYWGEDYDEKDSESTWNSTGDGLRIKTNST